MEGLSNYKEIFVVEVCDKIMHEYEKDRQCMVDSL